MAQKKKHVELPQSQMMGATTHFAQIDNELTVFMYRRNKTIEWRNREIYADFCAHLRNGMPAMQAYAACAHRYDLDEDSIRKIVRNQAKCK